MPSIEEVGARLVLLGQKQAAASADAMKKSIASIGDTTKTTNKAIIAANKEVIDSNARVKASRAELAAAQQDLAAKIAAANAAINASDAKVAAQADAEVTAQRARIKELQASAVAASSARMSANAGLTAAKTTAAHEATTKSAGKASTALKTFASVGKYAAVGVGALGATLAYQGVKSALSFSSAMELVHTQAGIAQNRIGGLSQALKAMSPSVLQTPTALADQLYRIASSTSGMGKTNVQLLAMTKAAAQLAAIGGPGTDPEQTARILGGVTASGVKGAGTPQDIVALANATVGTGDMKMQDFIDFIGTGVLSSAKLSGVTLPQVSAFAALQGDNLMNGSVSGHSLAHALMLMAAPSVTATKAFGAIGMDPSKMGVLMQTQGLPAALKYLSDSLKGPMGKNADLAQLAKYEPTWTPAMLKQAQTQGLGSMGVVGQQAIEQVLTRAFGGAKQAIPIITAIQQQPRYNTKINEAQKQIGDFADTWKQTMNTPANVFKRWDLDLKQFETTLGEKLIPRLLTFGNWIAKHKTLVEGLAIGIGVLMVGAIGAWIASMIAATAAGLGFEIALAPLLGIVALIVVGVLALTVGIVELYKHWDQIWTWMANHKAYAAIILIAGLVLAPFITMPIVLAGIATHWQTFWADVQKFSADGVNGIIDIVNGFTGKINSALGWAGVKIPHIDHVTWGQSGPGQQQPISVNAAQMGGAPAAVGAYVGAGGISGNNAKLMATGGLITNTPTAIVGEGGPHPEWVIPTDPAYRARALSLYASLGTQLLKGGGPIGKILGVAKSVVDPFGLLGKASHAVAGVALDPLKSAALAAANMLPAGWVRQGADGIINKLYAWAAGMGGGTGGAAPAAGNVAGVAALGQQMAAARGWTGAQWNALNAVAMRESDWNPNAVNKSSGAYGIGQALGHGHPYNLGDAPAQITWMLDYISGRYGTPSAAWAHEQNFGWYRKGGVLPVASYDSGGLLPTGLSVAHNGTGRPEPVGHGLEGTTINLTINGSIYGDRKKLLYEMQQTIGAAVARRSGRTR